MRECIRSRLAPDFPWTDRIFWFDSIGSTNTYAKQLAAAGAAHGTVVIAAHQTGGRGRLGRSFHSPAGTGIYMSVILRPQCPPDRLMHLTCAAGCCMCDAVEQVCGVRPGIKWINDLVLEQRKVGGILVEMGLNAQGLTDYAVIGIGINCNQSLADFPQELLHIAGSLAMFTGKQTDTATLTAAMLCRLETMSRQLLTHKDSMMERYRADCITLGKEIQVLRGDEAKAGHALDVDGDGALLVQYPDGTTAVVNSGEVSVRGMYGYL